MRPLQNCSETGKSLETRPLLCRQNIVTGQPRPGHNRLRYARQNTAANDLGKSRKQPAGKLAGTAGAVRDKIVKKILTNNAYI